MVSLKPSLDAARNSQVVRSAERNCLNVISGHEVHANASIFL